MINHPLCLFEARRIQVSLIAIDFSYLCCMYVVKPLAKVSFEGMSISSDGSQVSTQSTCSHLSKQGLPSQQGTFSETKKQAKERSISPHKQSVFPQAFKHTDSTPKASKVNVPSQVNKQVVSPQVGKLRAHASQQSIQSKVSSSVTTVSEHFNSADAVFMLATCRFYRLKLITFLAHLRLEGTLLITMQAVLARLKLLRDQRLVKCSRG